MKNFQSLQFDFHTHSLYYSPCFQIYSPSSLNFASCEIISESNTILGFNSGDFLVYLHPSLKIEPPELSPVPGVTNQPKCRHVSFSWSEYYNHRIQMHATHLPTPAFSKYNCDVLRELNLEQTMPFSSHVIQNTKESCLSSQYLLLCNLAECKYILLPSFIRHRFVFLG